MVNYLSYEVKTLHNRTDDINADFKEMIACLLKLFSEEEMKLKSHHTTPYLLRLCYSALFETDQATFPVLER